MRKVKNEVSLRSVLFFGVFVVQSTFSVDSKLRDGIVKLYKSAVMLAYYRADIIPGDSVGTEYIEAGIDDALANLPADVQLSAYRALDDFETEHGVSADQIRHAIPRDIAVDGATAFSPDYGDAGNSVLGNHTVDGLIPVPPAFRR